jgi:hypothetical protein
MLRVPGRFHRDQGGSVSIATVFTVLLLVMLLGMVMNAGRHIDGKIRMQNAADASAYSGGVVIARGMNTLAFTNHLLSDVFALTAFMREGEARDGERYMPGILAAWDKAGSLFEMSQFEKFERLGAAIHDRVVLEQDLVRTYSEWAEAASELILPVLEQILEEEMIPEFQRAAVRAYPDIAQAAAREAAQRNGEPSHGRGRLRSVLWRTNVQTVGGAAEAFDRTLDVVDPLGDVLPNLEHYARSARRRRDELAHHYLREWNDACLVYFDREAKMCQFSSMWRGFSCGHLEKLLKEEYPGSNLPHVIRMKAGQVLNSNVHLDHHFTFVGVVYWKKLPELIPGVFRNPIESDAMAYAAVRVFVPRRRLIWYSPSFGGPSALPIGGVPGDFPNVRFPVAPSLDDHRRRRWHVVRQSVPVDWDLFNQSWTAQLVPATQASLGTILETAPQHTYSPGDEPSGLPGGGAEIPAAGDTRPPLLGGLGGREIGVISPH